MATVEYFRPGHPTKKIEVKNLGWLLRHASESTSLIIKRDSYKPGQDGALEPNLLLVSGDTEDAHWIYYTNFASWTVLTEWVNRPRFAHLWNHREEDGYQVWSARG